MATVNGEEEVVAIEVEAEDEAVIGTLTIKRQQLLRKLVNEMLNYFQYT